MSFPAVSDLDTESKLTDRFCLARLTQRNHFLSESRPACITEMLSETGTHTHTYTHTHTHIHTHTHSSPGVVPSGGQM
ncbi:Nance-Horan syndrome protein [Dissostichus eleginoides]|uniref:Nance-Horan syndrome protein n=1 Tax=Dissostichus eleginoides TaxID=100907 RepID=A0AAD9CAE8_DISEL|nr:Nance-Horan syndrome protein [Dissostichus eleginoides]